MDLPNRNSFMRGFEIGVSETVRFLFHQLTNELTFSHSDTQLLHRTWHISSYIKEVLVFKIDICIWIRLILTILLFIYS